MKKKFKYSVVDAFSGAGGLSLGLNRAGFQVKYAFDNNEQAINTYNANIKGSHGFVKDIKILKGEEILSSIGLNVGELDLLAGGPPCQGFSRQKRGAHDGDERNNLVLEFARLVKELQPKIFLLENVDMLGLKRGEYYFSKVQKVLNKYALFPHFYNSADYGVPQTRVRFITIGVRKDIDQEFFLPKASKKWKTVGDVLSGLPEPPDDYSPHPTIANHQLAKVTELNIKRFSFVPQGGGWRNIPEEYRMKCHQNVDSSKGGWPDVFGRLEWDGQCPTITGGFDSFTRGRYGHPLVNRAITAREAALIQGFPLDYSFNGNRGDVRTQIGNAVPPPLANSIGIAIASLLEKYYSKVSRPPSVSRIKVEKLLT